MPGEPDAVYVLARRVLLDALEALGVHREAVVLVGAQAVYCHTGEADLAVAEHTTDGDLVIDPGLLAPQPLLADALGGRGFVMGDQPGQWVLDGVSVDLMVPEAVGGVGRRAARLGPHGKRAARKARGLEGALVDHERMAFGSLDDSDGRSYEIRVAGPGALLVSKLHKLAERGEDTSRLRDKDALDVLRLLRAVETAVLAARLHALRDQAVSADVTEEAVDLLARLFGSEGAPGCMMAARAVAGLEDESVIRASCAALAEDLLATMRKRA